MDWIHPWIGLDWIGSDWVEFWKMLRGLDWIGSDDCYVQNYDGLCFFQLNRPRLYYMYVIISDYTYILNITQS